MKVNKVKVDNREAIKGMLVDMIGDYCRSKPAIEINNYAEKIANLPTERIESIELDCGLKIRKNYLSEPENYIIEGLIGIKKTSIPELIEALQLIINN